MNYWNEKTLCYVGDVFVAYKRPDVLMERKQQ